jgi:hypothetical protein
MLTPKSFLTLLVLEAASTSDSLDSLEACIEGGIHTGIQKNWALHQQKICSNVQNRTGIGLDYCPSSTIAFFVVAVLNYLFGIQ